MAARELWGQMYDTCDPVSKEISVVLKHLTTEGKTKDGSDTDYMSYFDSAVAEKYLLEIYLPSEGNTDYSLWFDKDGFAGKMSGTPTCSVLPILVKTTKGQDVAIKTYYASFKLNIAKEANDTESDFKQILLNFLRSKMYVLNGLIGENNEAYESDLVPFAGGTKANIDTLSMYTSYTQTPVIKDGSNSTAISTGDHPASKDAYYKNCFINISKSYKTFIKLKWQEKKQRGEAIYKHTPNNQSKWYDTVQNSYNNNGTNTGWVVAKPMTSEGDAFTTTGALSSRVDEKSQGNESCFYVNSLGVKFFTNFAKNARKIVSLDGTQIGDTNIVLRPMMYVIE